MGVTSELPRMAEPYHAGDSGRPGGADAATGVPEMTPPSASPARRARNVVRLRRRRLPGVRRRDDAGDRRRHVHDRAVAGADGGRRRRAGWRDRAGVQRLRRSIRGRAGGAERDQHRALQRRDVLVGVGRSRRRAVPAWTGRVVEPRPRQRLPNRRTQQPGADADRPDLRRADGRYQCDRDGRSRRRPTR